MFPGTVLFVSVILVSVGSAVADQHYINRFTIELNGDFTKSLIEGLRKLNFSLLFQITSSVYIFEYKGNGNPKQATDLVMNDFEEQVKAIESTRIYNDSIRPAHTPSDGNEISVNMNNLDCRHCFGMGVQKVWERNITGQGVTIAVNDVGLDTDLYDLEQNINKQLCKNFLTDSSDVTPNYFSELVTQPPEISNHGNYVASVIASVNGNNICSAGIAYDATLVGLKIYQVSLVNKNTFGISTNHLTDAGTVAKSLIHAYNEIDISVNAWVPSNAFDKLDIATLAALEFGATKGRHELGTIYVVPAGPCGNMLSNNIYTITISAVGRYGRKPNDAVLDASVLISGLRDGNNLTASSMVTTSYGNRCVRTFKGVSAAVAQISGIIALGLQANKDLKLRDVQHLLVLASEHERFSNTVRFETNGASRYFNGYFGFGLVNVDKFVTLASSHQPVPKLLSRTFTNFKIRPSGYYEHIFEFCYSCDIDRDLSCLTHVEQVSTSISFTTSANHVKTRIISPSETQSVLMDLTFTKKELPVKKEGNLMSVHFWDEEAFGKWNVKVQSSGSKNKIKVHNISITIYGTSDFNRGKMVVSPMPLCNNKKDDNEEQHVIIPIKMEPTWKLEEDKNPIYIFVVIFVVSIVCAVMHRKKRKITTLLKSHLCKNLSN